MQCPLRETGLCGFDGKGENILQFTKPLNFMILSHLERMSLQWLVKSSLSLSFRLAWGTREHIRESSAICGDGIVVRDPGVQETRDQALGGVDERLKLLVDLKKT